MKKARCTHTRGETLVEAIVSFSVVIMMLATITLVVRLAARLNGHAAERSRAVEASCSAVETGAFTGTSESRLLITFSRDDVIEIPIHMHQTELIESFDTDWEG